MHACNYSHLEGIVLVGGFIHARWYHLVQKLHLIILWTLSLPFTIVEALALTGLTSVAVDRSSGACTSPQHTQMGWGTTGANGLFAWVVILSSDCPCDLTRRTAFGLSWARVRRTFLGGLSSMISIVPLDLLLNALLCLWLMWFVFRSYTYKCWIFINALLL